MLEILLEKKPHEFREKSVWASDSRYYIDGKSISISSKTFQDADADAIAEILKVEEPNNTYEVLTTFRQEIAGLSYEDELAKLIG